MTIQVRSVDLRVLNMWTRMPFRYGIAALTRLPHLFVRAQVEVDGRRHMRIAAEGLPPKWFTKDPTTSFRDDLDDMLRVITSASALARRSGMRRPCSTSGSSSIAPKLAGRRLRPATRSPVAGRPHLAGIAGTARGIRRCCGGWGRACWSAP